MGAVSSGGLGGIWHLSRTCESSREGDLDIEHNMQILPGVLHREREREEDICKSNEICSHLSGCLRKRAVLCDTSFFTYIKSNKQ